ncbi:hypothetical protein Btru_007379 [Bulinus truncatus]|nr:hypothetical protein Btru_007379 [Bulinus truncatus]
MKCKILYLVTLLSLPSIGQCVISDQLFNDTVLALTKSLTDLKASLNFLTQQTLNQRLSVEERSEGHSGIKQTRNFYHGTSSYFDNTHVGSGMMSMHDHSNYHDTLGMGEVIVVLNGVEFRTRHNDYRLVQPDDTSTTFRAVKDIVLPPTPPEVLNQPTVDLQIKELREWFKAFKLQNATVRDYRQYFKPALCYIEGFWSLEKDIKEPFSSERHALFANSWQELLQQILYTTYTGNKDLLENMAFMPSTIISVDNVTGQPLYAQWNYRILCKPLSFDVPLKLFRLQNDLPTLARTGLRLDTINNTRLARYRLTDYIPERVESGLTILDKAMREIPGLDNNPSFLNEVAFGQSIYDASFNNNTLLNTGYYHRRFKTGTAGAMGTSAVMRGFHDEALFVAETTQSQVAPVNYTICPYRQPCTTRTARMLGAYSVKEAPCNLTFHIYNCCQERPKTLIISVVTQGGRNGDKRDPKLAFNGTFPINYFYRTPIDFYNSTASQTYLKSVGHVLWPYVDKWKSEDKNFTAEVTRRSLNDYNYDYQRKEVSAYVACYYDAVKMYASVLNDTLNEGGDPTNGTALTHRMWNNTFPALWLPPSVPDTANAFYKRAASLQGVGKLEGGVESVI